MKRWISVLAPSAFALGVLSGCAPRESAPPAQLQAARQTYTRAESGPAAEHNRSGLIEAREALDVAEQKFDERSDETNDYGYVAVRKAEIAEADGRAAVAVQKEVGEQKAAAGQSDRRAKLAFDRLGLAAKEEARGTVITLSSVSMFATDKAQILPQAKERLTDIAKSVKQVMDENAAGDVGRKVMLVGYTDDSGSDEHNLELSRRRADAVRAFFAQNGVNESMLQSDGRGEAEPIADNGTPQGRAENRRVEVVITPPATGP